MPDVFHTFFGISGLLLLDYFKDKEEFVMMQAVDPTYALPCQIVQQLGLASQTLEKV